MTAAETAAAEANRREEEAKGEKLTAELNAWELEGKIDPLKNELSHYLEAADVLKKEVRGRVRGRWKGKRKWLSGERKGDKYKRMGRVRMKYE